MAGISSVFTAFGLSASAGLNAYIPLLMVAIAGKLGYLQLGEGFEPLTSWWAIGVIVVLGLVEFFADKIPAVDTINDGINTFVRPAAGALLFAASTNVVTDIHPILAVVAGLLISGTVHAGKTMTRPAVTVASAGTANPVVSTVEDIVAAVTALVAIVLPWLVLLVATIGIVMVLRWRIRRARRREEREHKAAAG